MDYNIEILLKDLASNLNTTVEYIWIVLTKQAQVYAISTSIQVVIILCITTFMVLFHRSKYKEDSNYLDDLSYGLPMYVGFLICISLNLYLLSCIEDIITAIVNPEYWALKQILNQIK